MAARVRATPAASNRMALCERTLSRAMLAAWTATVIRPLIPLLGQFPDTTNEGQCPARGAYGASSAWSLIHGGRVILFVPEVVGPTLPKGDRAAGPCPSRPDPPAGRCRELWSLAERALATCAPPLSSPVAP